MIDQVRICNMAIVLVGGNRIDSLDSDQVEAIACLDQYDTSVFTVMEDAEWSFAMTRALLSPLSDAPAFGYGQQFRLPKGCLRVTQASDEPYFISGLSWVREGNLVLADAEALYIRYIQKVEDPLLYSHQFVEAVVCKLASNLAIPLAASPKLKGQYEDEYQLKLAGAVNKDNMQGVPSFFQNYQTINVR